MKFTVDLSNASILSNGMLGVLIHIPKHYQEYFGDVIKLSEAECKKDFEFKKHSEKRSLDSNAYAWQLMDKIAKKLNTTSEEIYIKMLKRYGVHEFVGAIEKTRPALEKLCKIVEEIKDTEINGTPAKTYKLIIGSSQYDVVQMSKFINGIVDDAKNMGIETLTSDELNQMLERWKV